MQSISGEQRNSRFSQSYRTEIAIKPKEFPADLPFMTQLGVYPYIFDLELSGRCNTWCSFCPRDEMKRGENFMSDANFEFFVTHLKEYVKAIENQDLFLLQERVKARSGTGVQSPTRVIMCGMGESLMHPKCTEWIGRMRREVGIRVSIVTNGLLLKPKIIERLVEADVTVVLVSVPGIDKESYSRYMKIDWDRVTRNLERAHAALPGRVQINATIPDDAPFTAEDVMRFWEGKGIPVAGISQCHNRGGFLTDTTLTGKYGQPAGTFCGIIARHNFIAWDGRVLSCCHDLHGENVHGHVSTHDFFQIALAKTPMVVTGPEFRICKGCNDGQKTEAAQTIGVPLVTIGRRPSAVPPAEQLP